VVRFTARSLCFRGKCLQPRLNRRLGEPQNRSESFGGEKIDLVVLKIKTRCVFHRPSRNLVTVPKPVFCWRCKDSVCTQCHPDVLLQVQGLGLHTVSSRCSVAGARAGSAHSVTQMFCCRCKDSVCTQCHPDVLLQVQGFGLNTVSSRCPVAGAGIRSEHSVIQMSCCRCKDSV
jgi:hypothetical protein